MSQVVLENLNPTVLEKLQILAQRHNRSLEDEIKAILEQITRNEIVDNLRNEQSVVLRLKLSVQILHRSLLI